jgi:hypothetical protein
MSFIKLMSLQVVLCLWLVAMSVSETPPNQSGWSIIVQLKQGSECVTALATISGGDDLYIRYQGHGSKKERHFYFHGREVTTFPQSAQVDITLVGQCNNSGFASSYVLPAFSRHLDFAFSWEYGDGSHDVAPVEMTDHSTVWKEGDSTKGFLFTIPADGIPLDTKLKINLSSRGGLISTLFLRLAERSSTTLSPPRSGGYASPQPFLPLCRRPERSRRRSDKTMPLVHFPKSPTLFAHPPPTCCIVFRCTTSPDA